MTALVPVTIDANYENDRDLLNELNQHLELYYSEKTNEISFNIHFDKNDHYATLSIDIGELLSAIGKSMLVNLD